MVHIDQNAVFCNVNQIRMEGGINLKFIEIRTILRLFKLLLEFQQFVFGIHCKIFPADCRLDQFACLIKIIDIFLCKRRDPHTFSRKDID